MWQQTMKHKLNHRTNHAKLNEFLHKKHNSLQTITLRKKLKRIQQSLYKATHQILLSIKRALFDKKSQWIITPLEYIACSTKFSKLGTFGNSLNYRILPVKNGKKNPFFTANIFYQ